MSLRPGARAVPCGLLVAALLAGPHALAAPTEADRTTARELASEGYDALEQKNYAVAEDRFRRADALVHAPTIVVDHARALVGTGRLVEAYERYALVMREGVANDAPASWKQALADAEREIQAIKPKLSWLVITIEGPPEPHVTVDGREVPLASLGAKRAIDPGRRKIRVSADGWVSGGRIVVLREGEEQSVAITLQRPDAIVLEEAPSATPAAPATTESVSPLPWVAFGVGGVGLAVGTVTGAMFLGVRSDLSEECPSGACTPTSDAEKARLEDDVSRYHTLGTISGIGFGVGLAGVATGAVLLLMAPGSQAASPSKAAFQPVVGPNWVGVRGRL